MKPTDNIITLDNAREQDFFIIKAINTDQDTKIKLLSLGIGVGINIIILRNRGGDIVLGHGNARMSVGYNIAGKIELGLPEKKNAG